MTARPVERVGNGRQVVDHDDVGQHLLEMVAGVDRHLVERAAARRGSATGVAARAARRRQQADQPHARRAQRLEERPLVLAARDGERAGVLGEGGAQRQLVAAFAAHRRRQLDHPG